MQQLQWKQSQPFIMSQAVTKDEYDSAIEFLEHVHDACIELSKLVDRI